MQLKPILLLFAFLPLLALGQVHKPDSVKGSPAIPTTPGSIYVNGNSALNMQLGALINGKWVRYVLDNNLYNALNDPISGTGNYYVPLYNPVTGNYGFNNQFSYNGTTATFTMLQPFILGSSVTLPTVGIGLRAYPLAITSAGKVIRDTITQVTISELNSKADTGSYIKRTAGLIHLSTITQLQAYSGLATLINVTDTTQESDFQLVNGSYTDNSLTIYAATGIGAGYHWLRQWDHHHLQAKWAGWRSSNNIADSLVNKTALQACVDYAATLGSILNGYQNSIEIYLTRGNAYCGTINYKGLCTINGAGKQSTTIHYTGGDYWINGSFPGIANGGVNDLQVQPVGTTTCKGIIHLINAFNMRFNNLYLAGSWNHPPLSDYTYVTEAAVKLESMATWSAGYNNNIYNITFDNCTIYSSGQYGLYITGDNGSANIAYLNGTIENTVGTAYYATSTASIQNVDLKISNVIFQGGTVENIRLEWVNGFDFQGYVETINHGVPAFILGGSSKPVFNINIHDSSFGTSSTNGFGGPIIKHGGGNFSNNGLTLERLNVQTQNTSDYLTDMLSQTVKIKDIKISGTTKLFKGFDKILGNWIIDLTNSLYTSSTNLTEVNTGATIPNGVVSHYNGQSLVNTDYVRTKVLTSSSSTISAADAGSQIFLNGVTTLALGNVSTYRTDYYYCYRLVNQTGTAVTVSAASGTVNGTSTYSLAGNSFADLTFNGSSNFIVVTPAGISVPTAANPTATAGTSAVNGTAITFMRSDAAPKVDSTVFLTKLDLATAGNSYWPLKTNTVAGFPLSSNVTLANLTATDASLTFSGTYNGSNARTLGFNFANANVFTVQQTVTLGAAGTGFRVNSTVASGTVIGFNSNLSGAGTANVGFSTNASGATNNIGWLNGNIAVPSGNWGAYDGSGQAWFQLGTFNMGTAAGIASSKFTVSTTTQGTIPMPSMTTTQISAITSPANGLMAYDNVLLSPTWYNGSAWKYPGTVTGVTSANSDIGFSGTTALVVTFNRGITGLTNYLDNTSTANTKPGTLSLTGTSGHLLLGTSTDNGTGAVLQTTGTVDLGQTYLTGSLNLQKNQITSTDQSNTYTWTLNTPTQTANVANTTPSRSGQLAVEGANFNTVQSVNANYATSLTDYFIAVDASAGAVTITLKNGTGIYYNNGSFNVGITNIVKKIDSSVNAVTVVVAGSGTIDGASSAVLAVQNASITLQANSTTSYLKQ